MPKTTCLGRSCSWAQRDCPSALQLTQHMIAPVTKRITAMEADNAQEFCFSSVFSSSSKGQDSTFQWTLVFGVPFSVRGIAWWEMKSCNSINGCTDHLSDSPLIWSFSHKETEYWSCITKVVAEVPRVQELCWAGFTNLLQDEWGIPDTSWIKPSIPGTAPNASPDPPQSPAPALTLLGLPLSCPPKIFPTYWTQKCVLKVNTQSSAAWEKQNPFQGGTMSLFFLNFFSFFPPFLTTKYQQIFI